MTVCLRCGKCCSLMKDNKPNGRKCPHLVFLKSGKTLCRIYNRRLDTKIAKGIICTLRVNSLYDFVGCPFNTDRELWDVDFKKKKAWRVDKDGKA